MKVGVSTLGCDGGKSGISQYAIELLRAWADLARSGKLGDVSFEVIAHEDEQQVFAPAELGLPVVPVPAALRSTLKNQLWHQTDLPRLCRQRGYDALFLPAGNRRLPFAAPCPTVGVVHDFSILHIPGKYGLVNKLFITRVLPALARRLTRVITISEASKRDIVEFAKVPPERITVIPHAADPVRFRVENREGARQRVEEHWGLNGPYALYISRIEHPGKNHVRLIRAFARLKGEGKIPHHRLVIAGSDWTSAEEVHRVADEVQAPGGGCAPGDILFTGFAPSNALPDLYAGADLFVFPSLWEGFGMPVLEAMQSGTPVACSNISSLPEVAGDAAAMFDPHDEADIARTLEGLLTQPARLADLAKRGLERSRQFDWERTARETLAVLQEAVGKAPASAENRRAAVPQGR